MAAAVATVRDVATIGARVGVAEAEAKALGAGGGSMAGRASVGPTADAVALVAGATGTVDAPGELGTSVRAPRPLEKTTSDPTAPAAIKAMATSNLHGFVFGRVGAASCSSLCVPHAPWVAAGGAGNGGTDATRVSASAGGALALLATTREMRSTDSAARGESGASARASSPTF